MGRGKATKHTFSEELIDALNFIHRYMMLIEKENEIYFFDRDFSCFKVSNLRFPSRTDPQKHVHNTLMDGVSNF